MTNNESGFCFRYNAKKSGQKGLGVYADEAIKRGSIVWRHVPGRYQVYTEQEFRSKIEKMSIAEVVYELTHVFGLQEFPDCLIRIFDDGVLINHSGKANLATNNVAPVHTKLDVTSPCYLDNVTEALLDRRYALVAIQNIEKDEEFTIDYASDTVDPPYYDALCEQYGVVENYVDEEENREPKAKG